MPCRRVGDVFGVLFLIKKKEISVHVRVSVIAITASSRPAVAAA